MKVEHTIHIEAPPKVVWAVSTDVERWPEWTPTVSRAKLLGDTPFGPGSVARLKQPGQPESDWTVTEYEHMKSFSWESRRPGLRMKATHRLKPKMSGTRNTLKVEATGILAVVLWPVLRLAVGHALSQENKGLKERCEAMPG